MEQVEQVLASAVFQHPAEEDARRQSDANVFTQPTSPTAGAPGALSATPAAVYRCIKKAVLRETAEMTSAKCGTLQPGETVVVVEISEVAGPDGSTVTRVRCEQGWTSILSSSGNVLLERVSAEAAADPPSADPPSAEASQETAADASPEGPNQTANADASPATSPDSGAGTAAARKRKRLSLGLSDDEEEEEEEDDAAPAPKEVEWVQCEEDGCGKWRRLPAHIKASDLPDCFVCNMNHWDATFASCEAAEEPEHNDQPAGEGAEDEEDEEDEEQDEGARRRSSARNKSIGRLTAAQQKAVARLKNRDTLSTIAALGDDDEDEDEEEQHSFDEVEHVESDFIQAKAAKKRPAPPTTEAAVEAQDDEGTDELGPSQTISKKPRRAAAEKQLAAQSSIFYDDAMEERCELPSMRMYHGVAQ